MNFFHIIAKIILKSNVDLYEKNFPYINNHFQFES